VCAGAKIFFHFQKKVFGKVRTESKDWKTKGVPTFGWQAGGCCRRGSP